MERSVGGVKRRWVLKFLAGLGFVAELYERLYHFPMLEKRFSKEVGYWINRYNLADEESKKSRYEMSRLEEKGRHSGCTFSPGRASTSFPMPRGKEGLR